MNIADSKSDTYAYGDVQGSRLDIKRILHEPNGSKDLKVTSEYFIWQNEGIWYAVKFNEVYGSTDGKPSKRTGLTDTDISGIAASLKYPGEVKNPAYAVGKPELSTRMILRKKSIRGMDFGADDYLTKPFSPAELMARIKSHIKRYERLKGSNSAVEVISHFSNVQIN